MCSCAYEAGTSSRDPQVSLSYLTLGTIRYLPTVGTGRYLTYTTTELKVRYECPWSKKELRHSYGERSILKATFDYRWDHSIHRELSGNIVSTLTILYEPLGQAGSALDLVPPRLTLAFFSTSK